MSVNGGPFVDPGGSCCYDTSLVSVCVIGRPFTRDQNIITAPARPGNTGWSARLTPDLSTLPAPLQKILAERRRGDALLEHASVASFARFSLSLMAAGAPAHLVEGAHQAALDEIRHAQLSFALASAYGGEMLTPGNMPLGPSVEVDTDLAKIARDAAIEGCIGETLASLLAAEQAAHATDPAVKQVFSQIAEDEARHAELAFQTIAWALKSGDARVWTALNEVFGNALDHLPRPPEDIGGPAELLEAHGEIGSSKARSALTHALFDVVLPCAQALLHQHRPEAVQPTVASFHIS